MGTSRGCYKLPAACVPLSLRHRMNYGSCCFEQSIVWVSESPGLLKFIRSYLLSLIPLMGGIFISNRFPGNANSSKLLLYLEAIRITWRPFLQGWAPFPKGISQSGVVRMQVFTKLPRFLLLSGCESSLTLVSIMLSFFIPPFLLLILLSNCMLLVYINTFDLGILIFCDLAKLMY